MADDEADIRAIRNWLSKQPHLPKDVDENLIKRFLVVSERSLEKAKATMDLFFCLRADAPEFFTNRDPLDPRIQQTFQMLDLIPLPKYTPEQYKCFLYRLALPDPDPFQFNDSVKVFFLISDIRIFTETSFPKGEVIIFDMAGFTFRHLTKIVIPSLRKYMQYTQEALPVRLKQVHIINVSPLFDKVMSLVKPLMKSEVAALLHCHQPDSKSLQNFIPIEILPNEYGGSAGPVKELKVTWQKKVEMNREWFSSNPWVADNHKRIDNKSSSDIMNGSFRTLIID